MQACNLFLVVNKANISGPFKNSCEFQSVCLLFLLLHNVLPVYVSPADPQSLANVSVRCGQTPQQLIVSWMESGQGREYWIQLYSDESLSVIRNLSVPHGTAQVPIDGLVAGTRYRVEIVSRAGPHYVSSQTAIGYTGMIEAPCALPLVFCLVWPESTLHISRGGVAHIISLLNCVRGVQ